jgi:hypothetical protein
MILNRLFILSLCCVSGCVSVNLGAGKSERAAQVEFTSPASPFSPIHSKNADGAWQNRHNGNSISYLSNCNDPVDPPLDMVTRELFAELSNLNILRNELSTFNGREALIEEVEGYVEGIKTRIHAVVLKKNNCIYTLTYVGVSSAFENDHPQFDAFLRNFKAP